MLKSYLQTVRAPSVLDLPGAGMQWRIADDGELKVSQVRRLLQRLLLLLLMQLMAEQANDAASLRASSFLS